MLVVNDCQKLKESVNVIENNGKLKYRYGNVMLDKKIKYSAIKLATDKKGAVCAQLHAICIVFENNENCNFHIFCNGKNVKNKFVEEIKKKIMQFFEIAKSLISIKLIYELDFSCENLLIV